MDIDRARGLIRELSDLAAHEIDLIGAGTDSAAFRVDSEWVVRFPLVPEAQRTSRAELALVPELAPKLPVAVPCPDRVGRRDGQLVFSAYRALDGEPLSDASLIKLSPAARARALDELVSVLASIHGFPLERAQAAGIGLDMLKGAYHPSQENLERELRGRLGALERATLLQQRRTFERAQAGSVAPVLLHADIKPARCPDRSHRLGGCQPRPQ
jgi:aminoglycoside phosphotransferase (APT) family kinase protein